MRTMRADDAFERWKKPEELDKSFTGEQLYECATSSWYYIGQTTDTHLKYRLGYRCRLVDENEMESTYYYQWSSTEIWQLRLQMSLGLRVPIFFGSPHGAIKNGADFSFCATRPKMPYGPLRHPLLILLSSSEVATQRLSGGRYGLGKTIYFLKGFGENTILINTQITKMPNKIIDSVN